MSSLQERLQLKRVPIDTWNIREQLCLASAVVRSGDQNWMSVSRALKTVSEPNRPSDWYSQKSCAAQYGALLEHVETPKRKKRSSEGAVETPQESILKRLTQERIVEIQKTVAEMTQQYEQLKKEIIEARNPGTSEERIGEMWTSIEASKRARERESARRAAWLHEREERRARCERAHRASTPAPGPGPLPGTLAAASPPPSSPLLTSLLKSSPVVTTPQHISHPANCVETISPSAGAPTLSMLLEKSAGGGGSPHENKHAAIEHIKSQLVQIEQQLKASSTPPPAPPSVDIDDIEIKAEDVYAFRDVDIHIPPVTAMHKPPARVVEKPAFKKDELDTTAPTPDTIQGINVEEIKEEPMVMETVMEEVPVEFEPPQPVEVEPEPDVQPAEAEPADAVKIVFPEVKFPTPEIKVISDELTIKEEVKVAEVAVTEPDKELEEEVNVEDAPVPEHAPVPVSEPVVTLSVEEESIEPQREPTPVPEAPEVQATDEVQPEAQPDTEDIPLPPEPAAEAVEEIPEPPLPPEPEVSQEEPRQEVQEQQQLAEQPAPPDATSAAEPVPDIKKEDDAEDSIPLKEMMKEEPPQRDPEVDVKEEPPAEPEETHTETDDDTPMELSREEEKDGKKRRDYSRKKKPDSRTCSGSESAAEASAPDSPSASVSASATACDADRQHRLWKKSVMLVYSRLCAHKYASIFLRPISDDEAPGYSLVIKRPMDLTTIRKNIEAGVIRTTAEFQRDVLLMLSNALMYNSSEHSVYTMAKELHEEAQCQLGMLLAAQAHAGLVAVPAQPARRKRRRPESPLLTSNKRHQHH